LSPNEPLPPDFAFNFPADLKKVVSYTTLKVLEGGNIPTLVTRNINELKALDKERESKDAEEMRQEHSEETTYHRILNCPLVKKETKLEKMRYDKPSLDFTLSHVRWKYCLRVFYFMSLSLSHRFQSIVI
jgi:hypothetical protein